MRRNPVPRHPRGVRVPAAGRRGRPARGTLVHRRRTHPAVVLLIAVPAAMAFGMALGLLMLVLASFGMFLLLGGIAFVLVKRHRAVRRGAAAGTAPLPARPAAPPRPERVWGRARERFAGLRGSYAGFECDAMQVLRLPALADVRVPSTARFVDAFAEAQALDTDAFPGAEHAARFVSAVDRAERAWRAAREAAERIRLSGLDPAERARVDRVLKLLTTARDSDNEPERLAAYARARAELAKLDQAGIVHVPLPAQAALDEAARGQLPA